jgi:hypothetical protein
MNRRVRLFERKAGWRFVFEVLDEGAWRVVQEREPGTAWTYDEAAHRASVYAELQRCEVQTDDGMRLADATCAAPAPAAPRAVQLGLVFGDTPNRGQLALDSLLSPSTLSSPAGA